MQTKERIKKSESLTTDEFRAFKKFVSACKTKVDCAEALEINRLTLDNILMKGTGRPDTIEKIRAAIK